MRTLTKAEAQQCKELRERVNDFEKWRNGRTSHRPEEVPPGLNITNEQRSRLEVLEFIASAPEKYFGYIKEVPGQSATGRAFGLTNKLAFVTTWTGETLATVTHTGDAFRDNFGGERVPFRCVGINGATYSGTYYRSSGNYCRLRRVKP